MFSLNALTQGIRPGTTSLVAFLPRNSGYIIASS